MEWQADSWHEQSEQLLHKIVSDDIHGRGCYLVRFSDVAEYEPRLRGGWCAAWTSPVLDLMLADWLISHDRWNGRGFATILHSDLLTRWMEYAGAALHEFAHYLTWPLPSTEADESIRERSNGLIGILPLRWTEKKHNPEPLQQGRQLPQWHEHGRDFVRACCHLAYRAQHHVYIRPEHVRFIGPYHSSRVHEEHFMEALNDELRSTTGSVREVLSTEPPSQFTRLWAYAIACSE